MFIVDLTCADGHDYEGWYDSAADWHEAKASGDLSCPSCGSAHVTQRPSFRGIVMKGSSTSKAPAPAPTPEAPPALPLEAQRALSELVKFVRAHSDDVGERFAQTALAIHQGEEAERPIIGTSTPQEEQQLRDAGVAFGKLPLPDIDIN